jgi:hypothetical protein
VPTPAVRPSIKERLTMNSTFGPGTMISANAMSANASNWLAGIMAAAYSGVGRQGSIVSCAWARIAP